MEYHQNSMSCSHLATISNIPISTIIKSKQDQVCSDCDAQGPNLWICLHRNCHKIGCSERANDHSTLHNQSQPSHCIHMNLSTSRIWCYKCKQEVFLDTPNTYDSDPETETCALRSRDSGHGSYSTLRTNTPDKCNIFGFERPVGLNVGMSGDASESSEGEDCTDYNINKPLGLVGLQNIGNTCYMNAALQALSNTEPLTKFFLDCSMTVQLLSEGRKPGLSRTYQALMRDIWVKKNGGYVTPSGILYGIRNVHAMFRGYHQHDTQEFLRNFMDQLHEELKQPSASEPSSSSDSDTYSLAMDDPALSSSYDSSEGEYETCDSGVSERSSLSDDTERPSSSTKRRMSRCASPNRRQRQRVQSCSVIDSQPGASCSTNINPNKKQQKFRSIISDIFDGKLLSSVQCLTCNRISSRVETFQDLSLPIPSRDHLVVLHGRIGPATTCSEAVIPVQDGWMSWILGWLRSWFYGPTVTLHDCLAAFFSTDELKGDNMYSCEKCNKLRNGIKFSKVLQLPEVLCIHLKRFRHELMFSSKISSAVSFPLKGLDMYPYLHDDCISKVSSYELFSVICHHGTAGGGHYICYALNSGQWYEFDDQFVTRVTPEKVQSCEAYVLFYRKVTTTADVLRNKAVKIGEECPEDAKVAYISKQWVNRFYYCAEPGPIDNSDFLCHHGSIHPDRRPVLEQLMIIVPIDVYDFLYQKFGGCPPLTSLHDCPNCEALQKRLLVEMETFVQLSRDVQVQDLPHSHYLSTTWYTQWINFIQKRTQDPPGPIDNSKININNLDTNEAAAVPEEVWIFFHNIYGGGPEIRIKYNNMERIESECSMQNEMDEVPDMQPTNLKRGKSQSNQTLNEVMDFVIPSRERKDSSKSGSLDRSMYCHGEPMETEHSQELSTSENVIDCNNTDEFPTDMEVSLTKEIRPSELMGNSTNEINHSRLINVVDDDMDDEEITNEIRSSKRHRRRRKNLASM